MKITRYLSVVSTVLFAVASTPRIPAQVEWENRQLALSVGTPGSWDDGEVWGSTVAEMGDGPCMFYTGLPQSGPFGQTGFATSEDGETWVRGGPVIAFAYAPSVLFDPLSETWTMWYSRIELQTGKHIVERATSADGSCASWTFEGPVLRPEFPFEGDRTDHPTVVFADRRFRMWYWIGNYASAASWSIGHATSEDGWTWSKHPAAVVGPRPVADYAGACEPHVIYHEDTLSFEMWYTFNRAGLTFAATGYATSLDGIAWCHREDVVFDDELHQQGGANVSYDPVSRRYRMFYEAASDWRWQIFRVTADWTLPRASFTAEAEADTGVFVFDAARSLTPATSIVRYDWDFGDGTRASDAGPRVEHRYERPGHRDVRLFVTDDAGRRGAVALRVSVSTPPPPTFLRGDCNDDGTVDISDAVCILGSLFLGEGDPGCDDACDSNDDGAVDISDAINTLGVLFLGNGVIPLPGMTECGVDPTDDGVECETFQRCP